MSKEQTSCELGHGHQRDVGIPFSFLLEAFWVQWRIVTLPWQALVFWVSCCTGLMVKFLTAVGAPPVTYRDKLKLREAQKIIEHMHQREDGFRRKMKDMHARIEARSREARRLEDKLAKVQKELGCVAVPAGRPVQQASSLESEDGRACLAKHMYFWGAGVLPVYWLLQQQGVPAVNRKFAWILVLPEGLVYSFSIFGSGPSSANSIIRACSLFLAGFVFCHWLHAQC